MSSTKQKLKGTPFTRAEDKKKAEKQIFIEEWQKLQRSLTIMKLLETEEFKKLEENWRKPWKGCISSSRSEVVSFDLTEEGSPRFTFNESLKDLDASGFVEGLLKGGLTVFARTLLEFRGVLVNQIEPDSLQE